MILQSAIRYLNVGWRVGDFHWGNVLFICRSVNQTILSTAVKEKNPCSSRQAERDKWVYSPSGRSFSLSGGDDYFDNKRKQTKWTGCAFLAAVIWILEVSLFLPQSSKNTWKLKIYIEEKGKKNRCSSDEPPLFLYQQISKFSSFNF